MKHLQRYFLRKYERSEVDALIWNAANRIRALIDSAEEIIVFGSALTDLFDDLSDLDLVIIFPDVVSARIAEKGLYRAAHSFARPIDFLCVDRETYTEKSKIGGVYWIAAHEGRLVWQRSSPPGVVAK